MKTVVVGRRRLRLLRLLAGCCAAMLALFSGGIAFADSLEDAKTAYGKHDFVTAERLFRPLAEQGDPDAQTFLGFMYHGGEGVLRDYKRAHMWFRLAWSLYPTLSQDYNDNLELIRLTEARMTPTEIKAANEMAYACQARNYHGC